VPVLIIGFQVTRKLMQNREKEIPESLMPVVVGYPEIGSLESSIMYPGTLKPERIVTVLPETAGKLTNIRVREGDRVDEGEIIASIEKKVTGYQKDQAEAAYHAALAQLKKAERGARPEELENVKALLAQAEQDVAMAATNLDRSRRLFEAGTISQSNFEDIEGRYNTAKMELENAGRNVRLMEEGASEEDLDMARANAAAMKAQYELAKLQYQNTEISAPVTGMVAQLFVDEGSMVSPQVALLVLVQDDPIFVEIPIPEKYYGIILNKKGLIETRVNPTAYPDADFFAGRVTNVARMIDPKSRTFNLQVAVENRNDMLRPGMYVNVEIVLSKAEHAVMVPESSLVYRNDANVVFVVEENSPLTAKMKKVDIGIRKNGFAEILVGLGRDDKVIIRGNAFLEEGQLVEIVDG
jgi:HlyD family secretion protein